VVADRSKITLVAIVGPTASGKSELAMRLAKQFDGEIIAADSRTIYKGMDIGTAKPTNYDQRQIKHWGLDLVEPGQTFSAAKYKQFAQAKILDITARGKLPILVGGTGLYVDAVLLDFSFVKTSTSERKKADQLNVDELQEIIKNQGYSMPENLKNKRHLIRAIERQGRSGKKRPKPPANYLVIGLWPDDEMLKKSIDQRANRIFKSGVEKETRALIKKYGETALLSSSGIVYRICLKLIKGDIDDTEATELFKIADWQYARRQRTWFKRNKFIQWFADIDTALASVAESLNN